MEWPLEITEIAFGIWTFRFDGIVVDLLCGRGCCKYIPFIHTYPYIYIQTFIQYLDSLSIYPKDAWGTCVLSDPPNISLYSFSHHHIKHYLSFSSPCCFCFYLYLYLYLYKVCQTGSLALYILFLYRTLRLFMIMIFIFSFSFVEFGFWFFRSVDRNGMWCNGS